MIIKVVILWLVVKARKRNSYFISSMMSKTYAKTVRSFPGVFHPLRLLSVICRPLVLDILVLITYLERGDKMTDKDIDFTFKLGESLIRGKSEARSISTYIFND